jgi:hypothetical protein
MGGCRPTSVSFNSSLDPLLQNSLLSAVGVPTDDVTVTVNGPDLDVVPPGIKPNFIVRRAGTDFAAIAVAPTTATSFIVTIPTGAGALENIRYTGAAPIWTNVSGGRVLAFDVPLPFP